LSLEAVNENRPETAELSEAFSPEDTEDYLQPDDQDFEACKYNLKSKTN